MHRGNRLREPGRGHAELFSCLFHGWKYGIDGSLVEALDEECFPQGVPKDQLSLRPVRCDTWAGFVFVNLDPEAESLRNFLGVIPEHLDPYHFEEWKVSFDCTVEIECNWKTCVDAFNEAYHLSSTHAWTIAFSDDVEPLVKARKPAMAFTLGAMGSATTNFYNDAFRRGGFEDAAIEVQKLWLEGKREEAARRVPDEMIRRTSLVGPESEVRERLARYREAGIDVMRIETTGEDASRRLDFLGRAVELVAGA